MQVFNIIIFMTSNSIIQLQLALQAKEQLISQNADLLFDKLIVKVCHSIESTPVYTLGLVRDIQDQGIRQTGTASIIKRRQFLLGLINGNLPTGWPEKELLSSLSKIMYVLTT